MAGSAAVFHRAVLCFLSDFDFYLFLCKITVFHKAFVSSVTEQPQPCRFPSLLRGLFTASVIADGKYARGKWENTCIANRLGYSQ